MSERDGASAATARLVAVGRGLALEAKREETLALILAGGSVRTSPANGHQSWRSSRVAAAVALSVTVAASALSVSLVTGSRAGRLRHVPTAKMVLDHLATVASKQPMWAIPGPRQYSYQVVQESGLSPGLKDLPDNYTLSNVKFWVWAPETYQSWTAPNGSGEVRITYAKPTLASAKDRAAWEAAGRPALVQANPTMQASLSAASLNPRTLNSLPTNPADLLKVLNTRKIAGGPPGNAETFSIIEELIDLPYLSPAVRGALFRVAALLPGVQLLGTKEDHAGQPGTAVGDVKDGVLDEIIFDSGNSALLAENSFVEKGATERMNLPVGTETFWSVYLSATLTTSLKAPSSSSAPSASHQQ